MKLFKSKADKQHEAIDILRNSVLDCTFTISEKLIRAIESENKLVSDEINYGIKQEVLCFYLLYIDRVAMKDYDRAFYEKLQDVIVASTCGQFVDVQFDTNQTKGKIDVEKWRAEMINETLDLYNERGENYSAIPLVSEESLLSRDSVLVKVVENIDGLLAGEQHDDLRVISEVPFWLIQTANDKQLVQQVNDIRKILK